MTGTGQIAPAGQYGRAPAALFDLEAADEAALAAIQAYNSVTRQDYGAICEWRLRNAVVTGQGAVITAGGAVIAESVAEFLANGGPPEGFTQDAGGNLHQAVPATRYVDETSLLLKRPWYRNYGHWLVDAAALLGLKRATGSAMPAQIVLGTFEDPLMGAITRQTCALLAPGIPVIHLADTEACRFRELIYVSPVHVPPLFKHPAGIAALRDAVLAAGPPRGGERRLFLPRRQGVRRLANHAAIAALLARHGFEAFYPETLPLAEQAAAFRDAAMVAGVKGAALTNILFCAPPCRVVVLSPGDFPDPFFWDLAGQAGLPYGEVFGVTQTRGPVARNDFTIVPESLEHALFGG